MPLMASSSSFATAARTCGEVEGGVVVSTCMPILRHRGAHLLVGCEPLRSEMQARER